MRTITVKIVVPDRFYKGAEKEILEEIAPHWAIWEFSYEASTEKEIEWYRTEYEGEE